MRDTAAALDKEARLDIVGAKTQVDRDILEKLEAPLTHLLRNALDHGLETPAERLAAGKPAEGTLTLEARHSAGMLIVDPLRRRARHRPGKPARNHCAQGADHR